MTAPEFDVAAVQARLATVHDGPGGLADLARSLLEALKEARAEARRYRLANREHIDTIDELRSEVAEHQKRADLVASNETGMLVAIVDAETERDEQAARASAAEAALVAERAAGIRIPRPAIHTGPKHLTINEATANYLRDAAQRVRDRRIWGSGVSALVASVLSDVAAALDGTDAEEADHG